ncbi:MAG: hypothetical protein J6K04_10155, partial [Lachnospiraceae bacterium]|nr:hypothetical protein [Lachnospiraceae bacterium]
TSVLDVDQKTGEITALKAGETTVTFLAPNKFNQANVVVTNALKVTVVPAVEPAIDAVQKTQNNFVLNFTDLVAANYNENNIEMVRIFPADKDTDGNGIINSRDDEGEETFFIKPVTVDKDNNCLVIDTYADFVDGATYEVRIGEYKDRFVASVGKVTRIDLTATKGYIASDGVAATPAKLSVKLYDANGIDVTTVEVKGIKNSDNITYAIAGGDTNIYYLVGNEVVFVEPGVVSAYAYFDEYNITEKVASNECKVYGLKHEDYVAKVVAWAVVDNTDGVDDNDDNINWDNIVKNQEELWVAAGDDNRYVVALLEDSRGNYFTTHYEGATSYNNKSVYLMDYVDQAIGSSFVFAANGYYVEFETLNPDNLLMYGDGEVITYKETKSAIKLNLYNIYDEKVADEIATVPLTVKPARYIKYLSTSSTNVTGVTDTFEADGFDSKDFTQPKVELSVYDQYGTLWYAPDSCEYEVELVTAGMGTFTDAEKNALNTYADTVLEPQADSVDKNKFDVKFNTKTIRQYLTDDDTQTDANGNVINKSNRSAVSFKFTETNSGRFVTVKVNLEVPNYTTEYVEDSEIKLDTVGNDTTKLVSKLDVTSSIDQRTFKDWCPINWNGHWHYDKDVAINLYNTSKGYEVGYSYDRLFVAKNVAGSLYATIDANSTTGFTYDDGTGARDIEAGMQMLVVTGPDNQIVPTTAIGGWDTVRRATSSALGVAVVPGADDNGKAYYTYALNVADANADDDSMAYVKTGKYTVQVRTIKSINANTGKITLETASSDKTASVRYVTVTNTNANIALAGQVTRDLREEADDIREVVAKAFNFNYVDGTNVKNWITMLGNKAGIDGREVLENHLIAGVDYRVGDDYVYIKSVTFKVPVDGEDTGLPYYYRTVAIGASVKVSTDIFFFDEDNNN